MGQPGQQKLGEKFNILLQIQCAYFYFAKSRKEIFNLQGSWTR